jgi:hypothetical protein
MEVTLSQWMIFPRPTLLVTFFHQLSGELGYFPLVLVLAALKLLSRVTFGAFFGMMWA